MDVRSALELTHAVAAAMAVTRLFQLNLYKKVPALTAYLGLVSAINVLFGIMSPGSRLYFWSYLTLEPLKCVLGVFAVRELLALVFKKYPGIRLLGRSAMYAAIIVFTGIPLLLTARFWDEKLAAQAASHLIYFEVFQRTVTFTLAAVLVTVFFAISRYPLQPGKNTRLSCAFLTIIFFSESVQLLLDTLVPGLNYATVDWTESGFIAVCLALWAVMMKPDTAEITNVRFPVPGEEQLLAQLDALNGVLARAARQ